MNQDWRKLFNTTVNGEPSNELQIAQHLGIIREKGYHEEVYKVKPRIKEEYIDLVYDIGQHLIKECGLESYLQIPETFRNEHSGDLNTNLFFVRIEQVLNAYKESDGEFLSYDDIIKSVVGFGLVPHLMIIYRLLIQKQNTPDNEIPINFEYSLEQWIHNGLYQKEGKQ